MIVENNTVTYKEVELKLRAVKRKVTFEGIWIVKFKHINIYEHLTNMIS